MIMPHPPRDTRTFDTKSGKAEFVASPIEVVHVPDGHLLLQTLRSHDQYNTTIYGLSDRYRGIEGGRKVVFVHPDDIAAFGLKDGDLVDITTRWAGDDIVRCVRGFRVVSYDTPRGSAAAYYPETNPLVPLDSTAIGSNTPTSKSVVVSLTPASGPGAAHATTSAQSDSPSQKATGSDWDHKKSPEPEHLS
jgi:formate dehydrogenase major subunit